MNEVRRAHFAQSRWLIGQFHGREIKTINDSFMAALNLKTQMAAKNAKKRKGGNGIARLGSKRGGFFPPAF